MSTQGRGVEPELTRLRRHARAMVGSQTSGDAYVAAVVEVLRADATMLASMACPRLGLFKLLSHMLDTGRGGGLSNGRRQMRQVLLLISVEQFSTGEVADIMGITGSEVTALAEAAGESLDMLTGADVMIVESEPLIAMYIGQIVTDLGLRVNSMPPTHARALNLLRRATPDLIIADGGCHPGEVVDIYARSKPPVIFISAFPEVLLTACRPEPVFLAAKPFDTAEMRALIYLALFLPAPD